MLRNSICRTLYWEIWHLMRLDYQMNKGKLCDNFGHHKSLTKKFSSLQKRILRVLCAWSHIFGVKWPCPILRTPASLMWAMRRRGKLSLMSKDTCSLSLWQHLKTLLCWISHSTQWRKSPLLLSKQILITFQALIGMIRVLWRNFVANHLII